MVYSNASSFSEGLAFVTEPEQHISAIRKDGNTAFKLEAYKNSEIISVRSFSDGLALFQIADGRYGCVNTSGEITIAPKFSIACSFSEGLATVWENDSTALKNEEIRGSSLVTNPLPTPLIFMRNSLKSSTINLRYNFVTKSLPRPLKNSAYSLLFKNSKGYRPKIIS